MSLEQAKAYIEKIKSDTAFRERVMAIGDIEARMALVKEAGFNCTADEIRELQSQLQSEGKKGVGALCTPLCHPDHCWC
jgi:predicted ribosomally synthesized peptide with nif11-like leader